MKPTHHNARVRIYIYIYIYIQIVEQQEWQVSATMQYTACTVEIASDATILH